MSRNTGGGGGGGLGGQHSNRPIHGGAWQQVLK